MHRILVGADHPIDQQRRPPACRDAMLPVAGVERIGGVATAALELLDNLQHGFTGAGAEDALVDQQARDGTRAALAADMAFSGGHPRAAVRDSMAVAPGGQCGEQPGNRSPGTVGLSPDLRRQKPASGGRAERLFLI
jgi:hypothetical protein